MNAPQRHLRALLLATTIAAAGCTDALAQPRRDQRREYPAGTATAGASASVSAMPVEPEPALVDGHKPWLPVLDVKLPDAPSEAPAKVEWKQAPFAKEVRVTDPGCDARRIREWYRVRCNRVQRGERISGPEEGVSFGCRKETRETEFCEESWVVFPVRRGDRRAFEMFRFGKWSLDPDSIITAQYLEGDAVPLVSVQGIRWGF